MKRYLVFFRLIVLLSCSIAFTACTPFNSAPKAVLPSVAVATTNASAIDNVWSAHPIKPFLLTRGENQFVAYFDANRQMTIAHRVIGKPWRFHKVDSWLGWDSHNYVTMELDKQGYLHVMGNMHGDSLEYFRMTKPMLVRSIERVGVMVDKHIESRMTYPIFLLNKNNDLIVKYRNGGSGNGDEIYNIYNAETQQWRRLHANQFLDGQGLMSGYFEGPTLGPDGNFHLIWVWRNEPDSATNHSLSYAKSADLVTWTDSSGKELTLPLTLANTEVVDPVPPRGGMINGNVKLGFDQQNRPVISYHKYDTLGNTQFYVVRKQGQQWHSIQISDWKNYRWEFGGTGSLGRFDVKPESPEILDKNTLGVIFRKGNEVMQFVLDAKTLKTLRVEPAQLYPQVLDDETKRVNPLLLEQAQLPIEFHVFKGVGDKGPEGEQYYLSWLSQPGNRDLAHSVISYPSVLLLQSTAAK